MKSFPLTLDESLFAGGAVLVLILLFWSFGSLTVMEGEAVFYQGKWYAHTNLEDDVTDYRVANFSLAPAKGERVSLKNTAILLNGPALAKESVYFLVDYQISNIKSPSMAALRSELAEAEKRLVKAAVLESCDLPVGELNRAYIREIAARMDNAFVQPKTFEMKFVNLSYAGSTVDYDDAYIPADIGLPRFANQICNTRKSAKS